MGTETFCKVGETSINWKLHNQIISILIVKFLIDGGFHPHFSKCLSTKMEIIWLSSFYMVRGEETGIIFFVCLGEEGKDLKRCKIPFLA